MDSIERRVLAFRRRAEKHLRTYGQLFGTCREPARRRTGPAGPIDVTSYDYLGLNGDQRIVDAATRAASDWGTGAGGVRLLSGTSELHLLLEDRVARFHGTTGSLVFSSTYMANISAIPALVGRDDVVLCDRLCHASILDGCRLSGARLVRFKHCDVEDLEHKLYQARHAPARLVVTESVFSLDGDVAPIDRVARVCRDADAWLMVDEAHAIGVLGENGCGALSSLDAIGERDIVVGSLSKAIPSVGGYVAASRDVADLIRHTGRGYVFSSASTPGSTAAAIAAIDLIQSSQAGREDLNERISFFAEELAARDVPVLNSGTPIFILRLGSEERASRFASSLRSNRVLVVPLLPPAVPRGTSRIRLAVSLRHSHQDLLAVADAAAEALRLLDPSR